MASHPCLGAGPPDPYPHSIPAPPQPRRCTEIPELIPRGGAWEDPQGGCMRGSPGGVHGRSSHCAWAEWQNHCRDVCCWGVRLRVQGWLACISLLPAPPCLGLPPLASGPPWGIRAGQGITDACLWGMANIPMSLMALLWQNPHVPDGIASPCP